MKNTPLLLLLNIFFLLSFYPCKSQNQFTATALPKKAASIAYFNPEVFPNLEELKAPTSSVFFTAVSDHLTSEDKRLLLLHASASFENTDKETIKEFCQNNNAEYAVIPKVKYFKVGIGNHVLSNQVEISMKVYDSEGNFITETTYNTYKKKARILGSAENSLKIATNGALKDLTKNLKNRNKTAAESF